jgi:hypothetical protein
MTNTKRIVFFILEHGSLTPAKELGSFYKGEKWSSNLKEICRAMRKKKILTSEKDGKFERYTLHPYIKTLPSLNVSKDYSQEAELWEHKVGVQATLVP